MRGLARGLGSQATVLSPSFQLVRIYAGPLQLAHVDLYRLDAGSSLAELGLEELLDQGIVVVEWGDRLPDAEGLRISLEPLDESTRRVRWTW